MGGKILSNQQSFSKLGFGAGFCSRKHLDFQSGRGRLEVNEFG
jgi:hypothetical protein